jgi:hypothetical protein
VRQTWLIFVFTNAKKHEKVQVAAQLKWLTGRPKMTHLYKAFCGALLLIGVAGILPEPASAGTYYDSVCNCRRPDSEYNTKRVERGPAQVHTHTRYVDHTREVKKTRLIQENRLIVHVRPVINREIVVHRQNTVVRNITLHKVNTTNRVEVENRHETVNRYAQGSVRYVNENREVRGVNCNCGYGGSASRSDESDDSGERVSYRY